MRSAIPLERLRRLAMRAIVGWTAVAFCFAGAPWLNSAGSDLAARARAGGDWLEVFRAVFDDVADGSGDGVTFPAQIGTITAITPSGKTLKDVAPASGIYGGRLLLSDCGTPGSTDFGVELAPSSDPTCAAAVSFTVSAKCENNRFSVSFLDAPTCAGGVDDGATTEACSGGVDDGATTELCAIDVDASAIRVNDHVLKMRFVRTTVFRVTMTLSGDADGAGRFDFTITNSDTGEVETWSDDIDGGYRPVRAVDLVKRAGHAGEVAFDNLSIITPAK